MRKLLLTIFCTFLCSLSVIGQNQNISKGKDKQPKLDGKASVTARIIDGSSLESMTQVTVQLLQKSDSSFVYGTVTDNEGWVTVKKVPVGDYMMRFSFLGYETVDYDLKVLKTDRDLQLGVFKMMDSSIMLDEAVIEESLPPTQVVDDTLMYNVSAYRVPEGSVLEDLLKRMPGVEVDEDGSITVNGKTVSRILVDGEEYFGNDRQMATKNLPVSIIHRIKTYQRKSDLARVTGIDDGEEETVLDLQIKPNMRKGWLHNADGGIGAPVGDNDYGDWLKFLYSGRYTLNRFQQGTQFSLTANTNNSGRGNGVSENTQVGVNYSKNIGKAYPRRRNEYPLVVGGNVRWNGSSSRSMNESESETFTTAYTSSSFRNNRSSNTNGSHSVDGDFRLEWRPDTSLNIIFRPSFSMSGSSGSSTSSQVSFNSDPYVATTMTNILDEYSRYDQQWYADYGYHLMDSIGVNSQSSNSMNENNSNRLNGEFQFNKKLRDDGRNLTFRFTYQTNGGESRSYSASKQTYYQKHSRDTIMNRYNVNPTDNNSWSGRVQFSEPFDSGHIHLQLSYQIQVNNRHQNRETYVMPSRQEFEDWADSWMLPDSLQQYLNSSLSRHATNVSRNHTVTLQYTHTTDKINLNLGFNVMPQFTGMDNFQYMGHVIGDTSRVVVNYTPSMNFRYRWTKRKSIQFTLRSNTSQPSMEDMLDIVDNSNPLNIRSGNPGLLPSLRNNFEVNFQNYLDSTRHTINVRLQAENTLRNISSRTDYDPETGVSFTQPQNMTGFWNNWSTSLNLTFNQDIPNSKWRYQTSASSSYRHQESYARTGSIGNYNAQAGNGSAVLASTNTITAQENASVSYRNDWLEASVNERVNYNHSENSMRQNQNMDTYTFRYGGRVNARLKWHNVNFQTDINMQSRRGYSSSYNRDDLIWNAQASISFFRGNAATVRINWYDILNDESNVNRSVSTTGRTDTKNNSVHSYFMVNLILKANLFGTHRDRQNMRQESQARQGQQVQRTGNGQQRGAGR